MATILDSIYRNWDPDSVVCRFLRAGSEERITFGGLHEEAARFSTLYRASGVRPGEFVFIVLRHSPDLLSAFLGALLIGSVPSFLPFPSEKQDPQRYWSSHRELFARTGVRAILTEPAYKASLKDAAPDAIVLLAAEAHVLPPAGQAPARQMPVGADADDIAFLQHSSGTTGFKKSVVLTHRMVIEQVKRYSGALSLTRADRIVSWLPLYHDMGLIACLVMPLMCGVEFVMMDPFEWVYHPAMLFAAIQQFRATLAWLPNFAFQHLAQAVTDGASYDLSGMRAFISCSEPCKVETFRAFLGRFSSYGIRFEQLQVCYAMAETVFAVTQTRPGTPVDVFEVDRRRFQEDGVAVQPTEGRASLSFVSAGQPIGGLTVCVLDRDGRPLPDRHVGEICVAGPCVFVGYFAEPPGRRVFHDEFYLTGDLGFTIEGRVVVTGRKKDVIISRGQNYYAHDIESLTNAIPGVKPGRVVALGVYNSASGTEDVAVLAERADGARADADVARDIRRTLELEFDLAARVRIVPPGWLCKTTSGKISRSDNLDKYLAEGQSRPGRHGERL